MLNITCLHSLSLFLAWQMTRFGWLCLSSQRLSLVLPWPLHGTLLSSSPSRLLDGLRIFPHRALMTPNDLRLESFVNKAVERHSSTTSSPMFPTRIGGFDLHRLAPPPTHCLNRNTGIYIWNSLCPTNSCECTKGMVPYIHISAHPHTHSMKTLKSCSETHGSELNR